MGPLTLETVCRTCVVPRPGLWHNFASFPTGRVCSATLGGEWVCAWAPMWRYIRVEESLRDGAVPECLSGKAE